MVDTCGTQTFAFLQVLGPPYFTIAKQLVLKYSIISCFDPWTFKMLRSPSSHPLRHLRRLGLHPIEVLHAAPGGLKWLEWVPDLERLVFFARETGLTERERKSIYAGQFYRSRVTNACSWNASAQGRITYTNYVKLPHTFDVVLKLVFRGPRGKLLNRIVSGGACILSWAGFALTDNLRYRIARSKSRTCGSGN